MHRIYDFIRRHPTGVDCSWAVLLLVMCGGWLAALHQAPENVRPDTGPLYMAVPLSVLLAVVVALRRRAPERMLLLAAGTGAVQMIVGVEPFIANFAFLVIIFTAASRHVIWASRFAFAGACVAPTLSGIRWPHEGQSAVEAALSTVLLTGLFILAWVLGDSMRTRRDYYSQLEERAARLEQEREAQAKVAVAAERARIARELHDVVAHNVSVMVVQADGAAYVLDQAPEQTSQALETISGTGRQTLAEMRRLLGVLRSGEGTKESEEYVPQPGMEQLTELVDQVRGTGLSVNFHISGTPRALPSSVELTAYRVVQEALTNSRKHGGPDVGAQVRLTYGEEELALLAEDDGRGAQRELYEVGGEDGRGHGLIGMRERIGMVGGQLEAGPRPGGGFRISAVLPLRNAR
ncbi:sensor histidine kinase [Streptomyces oceani]|uniref:histidine kinase n=1 Tax=Streptomyces oceani TaxID=1075402 RepID=A0A1E7JVA5_9ACTN|nr:sensor histidine kinase [Streptomyces oceani]OEU94405.1 histidine kinase [Streptomyces oceani]